MGNPGIKVLSSHISKMQLQVLVFERCALGDDSCCHISHILKVGTAMSHVVVCDVHVVLCDVMWCVGGWCVVWLMLSALMAYFFI